MRHHLVRQAQVRAVPSPGVNPRSPPRAPALASAAPCSPGFARRTISGKTSKKIAHGVDADEDEWVDEWEDADPLATPAGPGGGHDRHRVITPRTTPRRVGRNRRSSRARGRAGDMEGVAAEAAVAKSSKTTTTTTIPTTQRSTRHPRRRQRRRRRGGGSEEAASKDARDRETHARARARAGAGLPPALERLAAGTCGSRPCVR